MRHIAFVWGVTEVSLQRGQNWFIFCFEVMLVIP